MNSGTVDAGRRALILAAHGSRVEDSNEEVGGLAMRLQDLVSDEYVVSHAFLELAEPSIAEAIDIAVDSGHPMVMVLPYFLVCGRHVMTDIPAIVASARCRHPGATIEVLPYFGAAPGVAELLSGSLPDRHAVA